MSRRTERRAFLFVRRLSHDSSMLAGNAATEHAPQCPQPTALTSDAERTVQSVEFLVSAVPLSVSAGNAPRDWTRCTPFAARGTEQSAACWRNRSSGCTFFVSSVKSPLSSYSYSYSHGKRVRVCTAPVCLSSAIDIDLIQNKLSCDFRKSVAVRTRAERALGNERGVCRFSARAHAL
jgi:hypothetical protein